MKGLTRQQMQPTTKVRMQRVEDGGDKWIASSTAPPSQRKRPTQPGCGCYTLFVVLALLMLFCFVWLDVRFHAGIGP